MSLPENLNDFALLTASKRAVNDQLSEINRRLAALAKMILDDFRVSDMESAKVGGFTIYRQEEWFCRKRDGITRGEAVESLTRNGFADLCMLSSQSIRAYMKEKSEAGEVLDPCILGSAEVGTRQTLRARKA